MAELTIMVPTRGRPHSVKPMYEAWKETGAFEEQADLVFLIDADDPRYPEYQREICELPVYGFNGGVSFLTSSAWLPMVPKLNAAATASAKLSDTPLGFMGDDHRPRTDGWVRLYLKTLASGPAVVSGPDGFRKDTLPTHWVMSASIVRALERMVPAPVAHMYCDNSVRDLALAAGIYRWLPDLLVEHMHPLAGKGEDDEGYAAVNSAEQYSADLLPYVMWTYRQKRADAATVIGLKEVHRGE